MSIGNFWMADFQQEINVCIIPDRVLQFINCDLSDCIIKVAYNDVNISSASLIKTTRTIFDNLPWTIINFFDNNIIKCGFVMI